VASSTCSQPHMGQPTPYPVNSRRRVARPPARWLAHNDKAAARRRSARSSTAAHQSRSRTAASSASRAASASASRWRCWVAKRPSSRAVAASPWAAWHAAACSCWIAACCRSARTPVSTVRTWASTPAASPGGSCDLACDLVGRRLHPTFRRPACRGTSRWCWPQRVEVGQSAVGRSDGPVLPLVGDEGSAMRALGDVSSKLKSVVAPHRVTPASNMLAPPDDRRGTPAPAATTRRRNVARCVRCGRSRPLAWFGRQLVRGGD
jgi:hypothetical protein